MLQLEEVPVQPIEYARIAAGCASALLIACGISNPADLPDSNADPARDNLYAADEGKGAWRNYAKVQSNDVSATLFVRSEPSGADTSNLQLMTWPPASWDCFYSRYDEASRGETNPTCDCSCGAVDPDCGVAGRPLHCGEYPAAAGQYCSNGICVSTAWTCDPTWYDEEGKGNGNFSYCDCNCGLPDPDCHGTDNFGSAGCDPVLACKTNGQCGPAEIPANWTCGFAYFGDGTCDCGCGDFDIDCDDATAGSCERCTNYTYCMHDCGNVDRGDTRRCIGYPWACPYERYNEGGQGLPSQCDCSCGQWDPDCNTLGVALRCSSDPALPGQSCDVSDFRCSEPSSWDCPVEVWDEANGDDFGGYCDCSCGGARDPDCDIPSPGGLWCGMTGGAADQLCTVANVCSVPADWVCAPELYDEASHGVSNPTCNSTCGWPDPDCAVF
jgi:hypothetical protein